MIMYISNINVNLLEAENIIVREIVGFYVQLGSGNLMKSIAIRTNSVRLHLAFLTSELCLHATSLGVIFTALAKLQALLPALHSSTLMILSSECGGLNRKYFS